MIPQRQPGQSWDSHKRQMADWIGSTTVEEMDRLHDPLHRLLCAYLGITSHAMREAAGEALTPWERKLAGMEEVAVLSVQRLLAHHGAPVVP